MNYDKKRYWYHVSKTLEKKSETLTPWDKSYSRAEDEPTGARLCVAPTIEQCLTAVAKSNLLAIYRTAKQEIAKKPSNIFDSDITDEGWIEHPIKLKRIGFLNLSYIKADGKKLPRNAAIYGSKTISRTALKKWKEIDVEKYILPSKNSPNPNYKNT